MSGTEAVPPTERSPHWIWMEFAVSRGMPEVQARGMTRDQLRACLLAPSEPLTGEPRVDRLDEDPDARAARREAQRKPWER